VVILPASNLRIEKHPAATIPGVNMGFAGCPFGGSSVMEWEK
jgi:hypothetical protein